MRWENLFADLEGELEAAEAAERQGEIAERTRAELSQVPWIDRLAAAREVSLDLLGGATVHGAVVTVGDGWAVLATSGHRPAPVVVRLAAVVGAHGLERGVRAAGRAQVERRLGLAAALRRITRDRSPVTLALVDGRRRVGTLDAVGADHLDLAEHPADEPRRTHRVSGVLTVPLLALASVAPVGETSWA
ncbi:hypothetical protein [Angustibacter sp. Root456]|uniref:hypothetical protein n=1 Tax=Angustibacter sp. Root456 TaxID=1736539 RepID=UPI0006FB2644|nr:hypothetical protein [Angustibacter sp. Root456]KQX69867.1 hypothetical protein ASD06_02340 [Angustibacter sp. Root456]